MIKEGDKVVCMQEHIYHKNNTIITHKKGGIYNVFIHDSSDNTMYITSEEGHDSGLWFSSEYLPETPPFPKDIPYVHDHFITLAEWRDRQINSILND